MMHRESTLVEMIFILVGVCAELKNRHGCGAGSQHEKFMKKHCRKTCGLCPMLVLVTGGWGEGGVLDSVELLNMDGTWNCPMPAMPEPRQGHTQTGLVTCGGRDSVSGKIGKKSCITFINGSINWEKTHTLATGRYLHSAWGSPKGIVLIGGQGRTWGTWKTTEMLLENGDTTPGFNPNSSIE